MTSSVDLLALGRDYYLPVYRPRQMILERGRGSRLWDIEGREYVDLAGGIAVCGLGHCHPELTAALVEQAARALPDFDIEVLEMHHRMKVDAPSGTALLLGNAAAGGRDIDLADNSVRARDGHTGPRQAGSIGFATLRGGSVVGDHSVIFAGAGERIVLSHHAEDRTLFSGGAIRAALWARHRKPGLYSMRDVLGLA